jgi:hypothetical protein
MRLHVLCSQARHLALGQTDAGRYLAALFIYKRTRDALILSARDMAPKKEGFMARSKSQTLPVPKGVNDLVEFFETHDMGEYLQEMPEAQFDIDIKKRTHLVAIDEEIAERITTIAKSKKTSSESLINAWLREKVRKAS